MRILGIESSCDETAAAVVAAPEDGRWRMLSSIVASQVDIHREWGGVVPELAARQHLRDICGVVERALEEASTTWDDIDAIAVTQGPGLVGSLLVGVSFAKAIGAARGIPVLAVHHLAGHIESLALHNGDLPYPAIVLVVSGGHTSLYHLPAPGVYRLVGRTRDDAAGEAYDKVAKLVGLGYPGGPIVDRRAYPVELVARDDERGHDPDPELVGWHVDVALAEQVFADFLDDRSLVLLGRATHRLARRTVAHELERPEETDAADIADAVVTRAERGAIDARGRLLALQNDLWSLIREEAIDAEREVQHA